jgi:hypothetical protein
MKVSQENSPKVVKNRGCEEGIRKRESNRNA